MDFPLRIVIFHSYVSLPEGTMNTTVNILRFTLQFEVIHPGALHDWSNHECHIARVFQHFWASEIGHFKKTAYCPIVPIDNR